MATVEAAIGPSGTPPHAGDELLVATLSAAAADRLWVWGLGGSYCLWGLVAYIHQFAAVWPPRR